MPTVPETFHIRLQPRASRRGIVGFQGGCLKIAVHAPPEDGKANAELIAFLAGELHCARSDIEIVAGHTARNKTLRIHDAEAAAAFRALVESVAGTTA